jgi:hypothetical protein
MGVATTRLLHVIVMMARLIATTLLIATLLGASLVVTALLITSLRVAALLIASLLIGVLLIAALRITALVVVVISAHRGLAVRFKFLSISATSRANGEGPTWLLYPILVLYTFRQPHMTH